METNETIGSIKSDVRVLMRDVPTELNPTPHYTDGTITCSESSCYPCPDGSCNPSK